MQLQSKLQQRFSWFNADPKVYGEKPKDKCQQKFPLRTGEVIWTQNYVQGYCHGISEECMRAKQNHIFKGVA